MKKTILIAIDDGHGTDTAGKRTPAFPDKSIMKENEFNAATAAYLQEALERNGFQTLMVAPEDTDTPLRTRVQRANKAQADAYISIHANAYGSSWNDANGIETLVYEKVMGDSETYRFAKSLHDGLLGATGLRNRGIKARGDLYVLEATKMHAALLECGFMTNREEAGLLLRDDYRRRCAEGICRGVCAFYEREYKEAETMGKRYQTMAEVPAWARPLLEEMDRLGCIGDREHLDMSMDMLRAMVLMERLWQRRQA